MRDKMFHVFKGENRMKHFFFLSNMTYDGKWTIYDNDRSLIWSWRSTQISFKAHILPTEDYVKPECSTIGFFQLQHSEISTEHHCFSLLSVSELNAHSIQQNAKSTD